MFKKKKEQLKKQEIKEIQLFNQELTQLMEKYKMELVVTHQIQVRKRK